MQGFSYSNLSQSLPGVRCFCEIHGRMSVVGFLFFRYKTAGCSSYIAAGLATSAGLLSRTRRDSRCRATCLVAATSVKLRIGLVSAYLAAKQKASTNLSVAGLSQAEPGRHEGRARAVRDAGLCCSELSASAADSVAERALRAAMPVSTCARSSLAALAATLSFHCL